MGFCTRLLLVASLAAGYSFAQFDTATVLGTVRDATGSVVSNAKITLRNVNTGVAASAATNSAGEYEFVTVRIGDYKVTAEAPGFSAATTDTFKVAGGARQRGGLALPGGGQTQTIKGTGARR